MRSFLPITLKIIWENIQLGVNQDLIDNLVKLRNEKIAIKLDVERVELEALQGANQLPKE